jgi:hypothetical protein
MAHHVDTVVNQFLYKHEHNVPPSAGSISEMMVCGLEVLWQLGTSVPPAAVCSTLTAVTMLVKFPRHNFFSHRVGLTKRPRRKTRVSSPVPMIRVGIPLCHLRV